LAIGVFLIVVATTKFKLHPFFSLLLGTLFVGFTSGMPLDRIVENINGGFGGLMTSILDL